MKIMKNLVLILSLITSLFMLNGCEDPECEDGDCGGPIEIVYPRTETSAIRSNFVYDNYTYPLKIYLPASYKTNKNLPIIFVLDGALNFEKAKNNLGSNTEVIVVGIGDFASKEQWQRRFVDLMPGTKCNGENGKHLDFYNFITKELVPQIDRNYDYDHNARSFMGHSAAGVFALVSMFLEDPENVLFHNFIASDPKLGCDPDYFLEMLHNDNLSEGAKKFKFYLALSGEGSTVTVKQFAEDLKAKEYTWLTFKYEEFLDKDHMGIVDPSFRSGLEFIFN